MRIRGIWDAAAPGTFRSFSVFRVPIFIGINSVSGTEGSGEGTRS